MADRVVQVTIRAAVDNYIKGMDRVRKATADTAKESDKLEKVGHAATSVGTALGVVGVAATGAAAVVVKMAADFDAQMSKVQAATNASASEMAQFREQALTAGAAFGYTATQVTEAQVELGKAGLATKDILGGGLDGVLALAASDNVELGKATQIAAVAMKQFGLAGKDVPHIADELAAGAGKALGGVEQLGDALNQSGLVASNFGLSLEETTGVLSSFADAGLLGSDAGTSLKSMLQALANPSKQSAQLMKSLGLNVKDANGNFLGAADLAQLLHDKLGDLSNAQRQQALSQIFGSDAVRAATVLYKEGADGIQGYIDQNNDAGYAMEQAAIKSDNLNGDLKKLKSAFQSGLIETGSAADSALRPLVQTMTQVVQTFNGLPEPLKGAALGITGVVGAAGLLGGGLMVAIPKIVEFRAALAALKEGGVTGRAGLASLTGFLTGPWGLALGIAAAAATIFIGKQVEAAQQTEALQGTLDKTTGALTKQSREYIAAALQSESFLGKVFGQGSTLDQAEKLGLSIDTVTRAATGSAKAYRELKREQDRLNDAAEGGNSRDVDRANSMGRVLDKVDELRGSTTAAQEKQKQLNDALDSSGGSSEAAASGLDSITDSAEDATQAISDTANAIKGFNSGQLDVNSAQRDFESAIDAVTDSVKENGNSLDVTTEKGRQNAASLDSIAQSTLNYAGALYQQTGSQEQATGALESGRSSLIAALGQYGVTGQAAQDYANKILGTPTDWSTLFVNNADAAGGQASSYKAKLDALPAVKRTEVQANVAAAQSAIQGMINTLSNLQTQKTITITTNRVNVGTPENTVGIFKPHASGGYISGPGSGTSDSIPAMLSNGEFVVRESSVRKYGVGFLDRVNAGKYANGGHVRKYATGGQIEFDYNRRQGNYSGDQGVSALFSMYSDSALSPAFRRQAGTSALAFQKSMQRLADRSDSASDKLKDLRSSADSLRSSVASAVSKFNVGDYGSAGGLKSGLSRQAGSVKEFAALLKKLGSKGVRGDLLAEIASLGTDEGLPLARSLASASASDIKSINSSYGSIQSVSAQAGRTVADVNYKAQIQAADKNARSLERQITRQSRAIQRIIAKAFGVRGFAAGGYTGDYGVGDVAGVVHGREYVMTAAATARNRAVLEAMNNGRDIRYMDNRPTYQAAPAAPSSVEQHNHFQPMPNLDPNTLTTVLGRQLTREFAGLVS